MGFPLNPQKFLGIRHIFTLIRSECDVFQVCGSMPYDDSDVKRMIKYQTERKVGFSRSKRISDEVKDLIHCILEAVSYTHLTLPTIYSV